MMGPMGGAIQSLLKNSIWKDLLALFTSTRFYQNIVLQPQEFDQLFMVCVWVESLPFAWVPLSGFLLYTRMTFIYLKLVTSCHLNCQRKKGGGGEAEIEMVSH